MYQLTQDTKVILRIEDGAQIPVDEGNSDYLTYLGWVADGNSAAPAPTAPVVPTGPLAVTPRQARLALLQAGRLADVEAAISALPGDQAAAARIEWDHAATVERNSPLVATLGQALNLSDADLDSLFQAAEAL